MKSLWSDAEAAQFSGALGPRVYSSRLLGRDKSLVLHGGGNTSLKLREKDVFGAERDVLYVKGSGSDLETIGMVLLSHGIFSFGAEARESYERMIELVSMAEEYLKSKKSWFFDSPVKEKISVKREEIAELRRAISEQAGAPMVLRVSDEAK